jgi:hypothetical protein
MKAINYFTILFTMSLLTPSCSESKYPIQIGDNYFIDYSDSWGYSMIIDTRNTIIIGCEIVAWNFDSTFIIAKQKPYDSIVKDIRIKFPEPTYDLIKKIYNETEIYNYWIIDKRRELDSYYDEKNEVRRYTNAVNGPFTYEQYWKKRREFGVSDSLVLLETERTTFPGPVHCLFYKWFYSPPARERVVE